MFKAEIVTSNFDYLVTAWETYRRTYMVRFISPTVGWCTGPIICKKSLNNIGPFCGIAERPLIVKYKILRKIEHYLPQIEAHSLFKLIL